MKLRGRFREVYSPTTGQMVSICWPATRELAYEEDVVFYWPAGTPECPVHRNGSTSKVFTVSNKRVCCAMYEAEAAYLAARAAGEPMDNATEANKQGKDYFWVRNMGSHCGHVGKRTLGDKCYECVNADKPISPRQAAIQAGETWYTPADGDTCPRGHMARRRVSNGSCEECEALRRPAASVREPAAYEVLGADFVLSRVDAKGLGFKHYRTGEPCKRGHRGWRYLSTGGCIECKEER